MRQVRAEKFGAYIQVSQEVLDEAVAAQEAQRRWSEATPEQRAQWRQDAAERRAAQRATTPWVVLDGVLLADRMGWSREYAEHLVQPYCDCGEYSWGWDYCEHARDLGLDRA